VVLGEAPLDNRQRLIRAPKGFGGGNAEQVAFRLLAAPTHGEIEPPVGYEVDRGDVLGHPEGVMEPKQHDVGAQANLARPRCYRCQ
jgi:hypothetical protein